MRNYISLLGKNKSTNKDVCRYEGDNSSNLHTLATGISGSGKSVFMMIQVILAFLAGRIVVTFNWFHCFRFADMLPVIREFIENHCVIYSSKDGIPLPIFSPITDSVGNVESQDDIVDRTCNTLASVGKLSSTQRSALASAIVSMLEQGQNGEEIGLKNLVKKLEALDTKAGCDAASKIRSISRAFTNKAFDLNCGKIIIFDVNSLDSDTQVIAVSLIIEHLHRLAAKEFFNKYGPLTLFIDECQLLPAGRDSTLRRILETDRKLGVQCLLARPEAPLDKSQENSTMNLCAYRLFFKPQDNKRRKLAKELKTGQVDKWALRLQDLKPGEAVLGGGHMDNGKESEVPVVLKPLDISQILNEYSDSNKPHHADNNKIEAKINKSKGRE